MDSAYTVDRIVRQAGPPEPPQQQRTNRLLRNTRWEFLWLCGLILSFAYERPLWYATPYDRTNPRLFDVMVILGVVTVLPKLRRGVKLPVPFKIWAVLVAWFAFCAIVWATGFLPWEYGKFSLFFAGKYAVGILVLYMAVQIPWSPRRKQVIQLLLVIGGVLVALYCIPEYYRGSSEVMVRQNLIVRTGKGVLTGPFGASYFELAQYSALSFAFSLTYFLSLRSKLLRFGGLMVAVFIGWPLLFSGARTGLGLGLVTIVVLYVLNKSVRKALLIVVLAFSLFIVGISYQRFSEALESATTIERLEGMKRNDNTITARVTNILNFPFSSYKAGYLLPVIGGGFYVAPRDLGTGWTYRVDYGYHDIYWFAFEQAGILGLFLFLYFLVRYLKRIKSCLSAGEGAEIQFSSAAFAYMVASLVAGIGGHNFWEGFGSGNFNTGLLLVLLIAIMPCSGSKEPTQKEVFLDGARRA